MREGWIDGKLGDVLRLEYGKPLAPEHRSPNGRYAIYGANGAKDRSDHYYHAKPSIIVGRKGSAGELHLVDEPFWPLDVTYFVVHDPRKYDLKYLHYQLTVLNLPRLAKGVKPGINREEVYSLPVRIPPLAEQRRIVEVLDRALGALATLTANTGKTLANTRELFGGHARNVLARDPAWVRRPLGDLAEIYQPKTISLKEMSEDGEYVVYGANGPIGRYHTYNHSDPEVLVTCRGATCGTVNVSEPMVWITGNAMVVRPKPGTVSKEFLRLTLESGFDFFGIITGSAQPQITRQSFAPAPIAFPPNPAEQERVVEEVAALKDVTAALIDIGTRKLTLLAELKQSLLARAFAGELA